MADFANKRCPRCGKRPLDVRLVQCPECRVPFEYDAPPVSDLSSAQVAAVTRQVLASWKLWLVLIAIIGVAAAGVVEFVNHSSQQLREQVSAQGEELAQRNDAKIAEGISNQVAGQFAQPQVQATLERVAQQRAAEILTNSVWSSLEQFREKLTAANQQLTGATNDLASLATNIHTAQMSLAQLTGNGSPDDPAQLTLVDKSVTHDGTNYDLTLFFRSTNNKPVGAVELVAGTYRQTARITGFTARNVDQLEAPVMDDVGDAARLKFTMSRGDVPVVVEMALSGPTIVKVVGDALAEELTLPIAADQMQLHQ